MRNCLKGSALAAVLLLGCHAPGPSVGLTSLVIDFPPQTVAAGQEQLGNCRSLTLHNNQDLWVNAIEFTQDEHSHHSNFVFFPEGKYRGPDGLWRCADRSDRALLDPSE